MGPEHNNQKGFRGNCVKRASSAHKTIFLMSTTTTSTTNEAIRVNIYAIRVP